ncbi:MAG: hypothetical protein ACLP2J_13465 [Acidimicrobiales bacterium]
MANYLVRVRLPDRPGALGAVASRIGAVGGDVVAIDILQRDGGVVVDELGVVLAGDDLVALLRDEILEVDGVSVEAVRPVGGPLPDRNVEILEFAAALFRQDTPVATLEFLTTRARDSLCGTFAATVDPHDAVPVAAVGDPPPDPELGTLALDGPDHDDHVATTRLDRAGVVLVVGRRDLVFRTRERLRLATMAELADHRWQELSAPSAAG